MHRRAPLIYLFSPLSFSSVFSIAKLKVKRYKKKKLSRKCISLSWSAVVEVLQTCSLSNQELWAEETERGSLLIPQGRCLLFWAATAMNYPSYSICADSWAIFKRMLWVCIQGHAKIYMSCSEFREDPSLWFCCVYLFSRRAAIFSLKMVNWYTTQTEVILWVIALQTDTESDVYMCTCVFVLSVFVMFYMYAWALSMHSQECCWALCGRCSLAWRTYKCEALLSFVKDLLIHLGNPSERERASECVFGVFICCCVGTYANVLLSLSQWLRPVSRLKMCHCNPLFQ